jgi:hypothetical protein
VPNTVPSTGITVGRCVSVTETARRVTSQGMEEIGCMGPDRCPLAKELGCKLYGRLNVQVEGQQDELGSFIFRTTGYNSVRTLAARLKYYEAASGGNTKHLPLLLRLRQEHHPVTPYPGVLRGSDPARWPDPGRSGQYRT